MSCGWFQLSWKLLFCMGRQEVLMILLNLKFLFSFSYEKFNEKIITLNKSLLLTIVFLLLSSQNFYFETKKEGSLIKKILQFEVLNLSVITHINADMDSFSFTSIVKPFSSFFPGKSVQFSEMVEKKAPVWEIS